MASTKKWQNQGLLLNKIIGKLQTTSRLRDSLIHKYNLLIHSSGERTPCDKGRYLMSLIKITCSNSNISRNEPSRRLVPFWVGVINIGIGLGGLQTRNCTVICSARRTTQITENAFHTFICATQASNKATHVLLTTYDEV